jgi:hypothetical protein
MLRSLLFCATEVPQTGTLLSVPLLGFALWERGSPGYTLAFVRRLAGVSGVSCAPLAPSPIAPQVLGMW